MRADFKVLVCIVTFLPILVYALKSPYSTIYVYSRKRRQQHRTRKSPPTLKLIHYYVPRFGRGTFQYRYHLLAYAPGHCVSQLVRTWLVSEMPRINAEHCVRLYFYARRFVVLRAGAHGAQMHARVWLAYCGDKRCEKINPQFRAICLNCVLGAWFVFWMSVMSLVRERCAVRVSSSWYLLIFI